MFFYKFLARLFIYTMRNRKLIIFITLLFSFISLYYITFTVINFNIQNRANKIATDESGNFNLQKKQDYLDSIWDKEAYKLLGKSYTYEDIKSRSLNFGLDLQGGMSIIIDIDVDNILIQLANKPYKNTVEDIVNNISPETKLNVNEYIKTFEKLLLESNKIENKDKPLVECFESRKYGINLESTTNDEVSNFLIDKVNNSIDRTYEVIKSRLDKYGVSQPNIQRLKGNRKIQIEISGAHNNKNIKKLLQGVGELKFYLLYDENKSKEIIESLNSVLENKDYKNNKGLKIKLNNDMNYDSDIVDDVIDVLNKDDIKELLPEDLIICKESNELKNRGDDKNKNKTRIYFLKTDINGDEFLNGDVITDARQSLDDKAKPAVLIRMNAVGKKLWGELTGNNIGKMIAATLDNDVIMAANVGVKITDGVTLITGNYSNEEAMNLAMTLKTGSLPVPIHIIDETIVGPTLSVDIQKQGIKSIIYGIIIILIFMIAFYSKSGFIANIAVIFNFLFIIGVLAQMGAVLTLPGIAGLILTLGMAIDANVLINERIKEELRKRNEDGSKKSVREAVKVGYSKSSSSIIDSNITTLLTGFVLYIFGSGPIRGFAVTLIIGIIFSFFTSVLITRYIYYIKEQRKSLKTMRFSWGEINENNDNKFKYNFTKIRLFPYIISISIFLIGIIGLIKSGGFNLGIDFTGGNNFIVKTSKNIDINKLEKDLSDELKKSIAVKSYGSNDILKISTNLSAENTQKLNEIMSDSLEKVTDLRDINNNEINNDNEDIKDGTFEIVSNESVESTMASDIKKSATKSIIYVLLIIFFYILFRFSRWQFGLAATIALIHDVLMIFAIYGISKICGYSIEVNQLFVAAILTILGYSINNTIIIYDRLREILNKKDSKKEKNAEDKDLTSCINLSINSTLTRTLMTSISTILVVLIIFLFGGVALKDFSYILMCGFIVGTYSSIFISATMLKDLMRKI